MITQVQKDEVTQWLRKWTKTSGSAEDIYPYKKADGTLLYEVVRTDKKEFIARHYSSYNKSWYLGKCKKAETITQTPYRLESIQADKPLYWVEGEKDVHTLESIGLQATTTSFGASGYDSTNTANYFKDFNEIRLIYDNDPKGIAYIKQVGNSLLVIAKKVSVITLPYEKEKDDVTDWLSGKSETDKKALLESQKMMSFSEWIIDATKAISNVIGIELDAHHENPCIGIAQAFHNENKTKEYKHYRGDWYTFNGGKYEQLFDDKTFEKELISWLQIHHPKFTQTSKKNEIINNLMSYNIAGTNDVRNMPFWINKANDTDHYMNLRNGVFNMSKYMRNEVGYFENYNPNFFTVKQADYDYVPNSSCPKWLKYISEVQPNAEDRNILQMLAGLLLFPDCHFNVYFFFVGEGGCGKSVYLDTITALLGGKDNVSALKYHQLGDRFEIGKLTRTLANISSETESDNKRENTSAAIEENVKNITDGGLLKDEEKYKGSRFGKATARLLFAANTMPKFADKSKGLPDRIRIIPFTQIFRNKPNDNKNLRAELLEELSGILIWALEGYKNLLKLQIFPESANGFMFKQSHIKDSNHELEFMLEKTVKHIDGFISSEALYANYKEWCYTAGYKPVGRNKFLIEFRKNYPNAYETKKDNKSGYRNVILKPDDYMTFSDKLALMKTNT